MLDSDVTFKHPMTYFMQVKVMITSTGQRIAHPQTGNGSGDFSNLAASNAFMELPVGKDVFLKGEVYRVWEF
jgi:molybdopterin molybdotransferase